MLEGRKPNGEIVTGSVQLIHAAGMHARPAVKLTKLAKKFQAQISIRASDAAEWTNAESIAKVMALRRHATASSRSRRWVMMRRPPWRR